MHKLLVTFVLLIAACGSKSTATTSPTGGPGEPIVDPTVPSWAPPSCIAYHKAVVQALDCAALDQAKQDEIRAAYDAASESWKAEQDADAARIAEVGAACESSTESVQADSAACMAAE